MKLRRAADVLPPDLLREVQQHCSSCALWIPQKGLSADQRRIKVLALRQQGKTLRAIAEAVALSQSGVKAILHKDRAQACKLLGKANDPH